MQPGDELAHALDLLLAAFERHAIRYLVSGSVASAAHGEFRATNDVDLLVDLGADQVAPVLEALAQDYYADADAVRSAVRARRSFNVIHLPTMLKIDVFVSTARAFDEASLARTVLRPIGSGERRRMLRLGSPEDVILVKLEWYRRGGEVSERQWRDVLGVMTVQGEALDREYLREWAPALGVSDLLERAMATLDDDRE